VASPDTAPASASARTEEMTPERRRAAFDRGELRRGETLAWASRHPDEVPLVNDEFPWIAATLADIE
jgi:hypothetical protein